MRTRFDRGSGVEHVLMCEACSDKLVFHFAYEIRDILPIAATVRAFNGNVSRRLGNSEIHRVDEGNSQKRNNMEQQMPLALRTTQDDGSVWDESAVDSNIVRARAAHAQD